MTEEELKQAAIELCTIRGIDPDQKIGHEPLIEPDGTFVSFMRYRSNWDLLTDEIKKHNEIQTAITTATHKMMYSQYEETFKTYVAHQREKAENDE